MVVHEGRVAAIRLPPGDGLPPPGFAVVTCEECGAQGVVPAEYVQMPPDVVLCVRCQAVR